jgi:hypothetical protein
MTENLWCGADTRRDAERFFELERLRDRERFDEAFLPRVFEDFLLWDAI